MRQYQWRLALGVLLVVGGALFLLQSLGICIGLVGLLWLGCLGAAGIGFLLVYLADHGRWWALIPGFLLLSAAVSGVLTRVLPWNPGAWGSALFLAGFGCGFIAVYLTSHDRWWAIIPGGVLLTLALVNGFSAALGAANTGVVLFAGLGLTFGVLSLVPTPQGRLRWAAIPGIALLVVGLVVSLGSGSILKYLWAVALIGVGIYVLGRGLLSGRR